MEVVSTDPTRSAFGFVTVLLDRLCHSPPRLGCVWKTSVVASTLRSDVCRCFVRSDARLVPFVASLAPTSDGPVRTGRWRRSVGTNWLLVEGAEEPNPFKGEEGAIPSDTRAFTGCFPPGLDVS